MEHHNRAARLVAVLLALVAASEPGSSRDAPAGPPSVAAADERERPACGGGRRSPGTEERMGDRAPRSTVRTGPEPRIIGRSLLICVGIALVVHVITYLLSTQLPLWVVALGGSRAEVGWLFAAMAVVAMVLRPQVGGLVDRYGARALLVPGAVILVATMLALGRAASPGALIAAMVGLGIANALLSTTGSIVVAHESPSARRGEALSLYYVASSTGVALGPPLGFALAAAGGRTLNLTVVVALGLAVAVLALLLRTAHVTPAAIGRRRLWSRHAVAASLALIAVTMGHSTVYAFLPMHATAAGLGHAPWFFPLMSGCTIACRLVLGRTSDRVGRAPVLVPAIGALALGNAALALPPTPLSLVLSAVLLGAGNSMLYPVLVALVVDRTPTAERGLAIGTLSGAWDVGVFIGSPVIALLVHHQGYGAGFLASAVAAVTGLVVFLLAERRRVVVSLATGG
jgi:MFS family permease